LVTVAVAIGSNLGDRVSHVTFARGRLERILTSLRLSSLHQTEPVGVPSGQPAFLNAAAVGETALSARELLQTLLAIERERGRERPFSGAPRTLDLDLILFGDCVIDEPGLLVPHPRFRDRPFVLGPLGEIAPQLRDPVTTKTVGELFAALMLQTPDAEARRP
jgi:2-amino-4-hydroxy-6-hydroxymethyldihydropteridine diphosphokinase